MKKMSVPTTKISGRIEHSVGTAKKITPKQQTSKAADVSIPGEITPDTILQELPPEFLPDLASVKVTDGTVSCFFDDGFTVSFPVQWSDKLSQATASQQQAFDFNAHFIFWDEIDEIIGVRNILLGKKLVINRSVFIIL